MKWEIALWAFFLVLGVIGSIWNWGHLYFTALPSALLLIVAIVEERKEERRKNTYKDN